MNDDKSAEPTRAVVLARQATPDIWQMISTIAASAHQAHTLGVSSQADAAMKMLTGHELGLPPMASLRSIYIVKGNATIKPKAAWALIIRHPDFDGIIEEKLTDEKGKFLGWKITLKRKDGFQATRSFTLADAVRAGLADKDVWKSYPENLCYWRAMGFAEDVAFPDVTMGIYRSDELGATITPDGDVIEGEWKPAPIAQEAQAATQTATPSITLDELIDKYGADKVMEAAQGRIPATADEVALVATLLEQPAN